jgi:hypothetical protein
MCAIFRINMKLREQPAPFEENEMARIKNKLAKHYLTANNKSEKESKYSPT